MRKFVLTPGGAMRGALFERLMGRDAAAGQLAPGTLVGPFRIVRLVARSTSVSMYLAVHDDAPITAEIAIHVGEQAVLRRVLGGKPGCGRAAVLESGKLEDGREWVAVDTA